MSWFARSTKRFVLLGTLAGFVEQTASAQEASVCNQPDPVRGTDILFLAWSDSDSPALEIDVPSWATSVEVRFLLDLPTGRQSWSTTLERSAGSTEIFAPVPPEADLAVLDMPGMLTALARNRNAAGEVTSSSGAEAIPVTLAAGALTRRAVTPVLMQLEVGGVLVDFYDRGEVGFVQDTSEVPPQPHEEPVDRE